MFFKYQRKSQSQGETAANYVRNCISRLGAVDFISLMPLSPYLILRNKCIVDTSWCKYGSSIHGLFFFSEMEEGSPLKLAFEIWPNAPAVLTLPAESVCDPCQSASCQHESTPASGLLSANDFSIVLGTEEHCPMERSPLKRTQCCNVICFIKTREPQWPL